MDFGLLGPLLVHDDDEVRVVPASRQRVLLAALLLNANAVVRPDQLCELVWDGNPPPGARGTLQSYVMRLRRVLGPAVAARLHTHLGGYAIEVRDGELDVQRFQATHVSGSSAVKAEQWGSAAAQLQTGLALWRGEALADIPSDLLRHSYVPQLDEMRMQALEMRIDADLRRGLHRELVAELRHLVAEFPFRERLWESLMVALHRSGQQAAALAAYRDARRLMIEELGVEPGAGMQQIHQNVLNAGRGVLPQQWTERPAMLPADIADFTGRAAHVTVLDGLLRREPRSTVGVVGISGMPGVGKTALAVHVAHRLRWAFPDGQLYVNLRGMNPSPAAPGDVLARLLRALGVAGIAIPGPVDQRAEMYRQRLAGRRVLVVLDDAADEAQVAPLLPGHPGCGVIVTSRFPLTGLAGAHHMMLDVLAEEEAVRMLARIGGSKRVAAEPGAAVELSRLCGRLPLALRIAGAKLAARPHWSLADMATRLADEQRRLDELAFGALDLRAALATSYRRLTERQRRLLERLALLDEASFTPRTCAVLLDDPHAGIEDLLEELAHARLLEAGNRGPDGRVRYHFREFVRLYVRERAMAAAGHYGRYAVVAASWNELANPCQDRK